MKRYLKHGRALWIGLLGLGSVALSATPARAASLPVVGKAVSGCAAAPTSQPFAKWGDTNVYKLVAGSSFGSTATGWSLKGGAHLVPGGEPFAVTGGVSASSLALPKGASAQSPFDCVDIKDPTWRFFLESATASASSLQVAVVYLDPVLGQIATPVGVVNASPGWLPSGPQLTNSAVQSLLHGGSANLALRFTAAGGTTNIDDVFIDPRMRW